MISHPNPNNKKSPASGERFFMAEGMGFEPMWTCAQTVFKTASL